MTLLNVICCQQQNTNIFILKIVYKYIVIEELIV